MKMSSKLFACLHMMLCGCHGGEEKSGALIQANELHLESMAIQENLQKELVVLKSKAVEENDTIVMAKTDSLLVLMKLWEDGVSEVPGFEHTHHDGHHAQKHAPRMTDESMLEYQRSAKKAIEEMAKEVDKIKVVSN